MKTGTTPILSVNGGSSSLKYAYFGASRTTGKAKDLDEVFAAVAKLGPPPKAVVHRVVHGGPKLFEPSRVTDAVMATLREAIPFAPLHLPSEIAAIEAVRDKLGSYEAYPQIVCFDTSFHRSLAEVAYTYAIPETYRSAGLRRYGFHGLSYEHLVATSERARTGRVILAHLGSGASMAAVKDGVSIDTTMGLTPTGGLVMSTRAGDLDPGVVVRLAREVLDAATIENLLDRESGLKALAGTNDMQAIVETKDRDPKAAFAFDVFVHAAAKQAAAMAASLGGVDAIVYTGGMGEKSAPVRDAITEKLRFLGAFEVSVIPADEEERLHHHAERVLAR